MPKLASFFKLHKTEGEKNSYVAGIMRSTQKKYIFYLVAVTFLCVTLQLLFYATNFFVIKAFVFLLLCVLLIYVHFSRSNK